MKVDLNIGDTILTGKFKNKKVVVKSFGKDDKGQYTYNGGKKLFPFRIKKLMPVKGAEMFKEDVQTQNNIPGGKGDTLAIRDIDETELRMGLKVEMEHTTDPQIALEITLDHLAEDPKYYTNLRKVHKEYKMKADRYKNIVKEEARKIMNERNNEDFTVKFGKFSIELDKSQLYFKRDGKLVKAQPVKSDFGLRALLQLAKTIAKKQGHREVQVGRKTYSV